MYSGKINELGVYLVHALSDAHRICKRQTLAGKAGRLEFRISEELFVDFEVSNPRTSTLKNPYYVEDPRYSREYKRMALKCAFPSGFGNGLYHIVVGVWVCIAGFFSMAVGMGSGNGWIMMAVGAVVATAVAIAYGRYLQLKALFPRGASMAGCNGNAPVIRWLLPAVFFVAFPIYAFATANPACVQITIGSVFSLLTVLAYAKTNRIGLLAISVVCILLPLGLAYTGMYQNAGSYGILVSTVPYEGIVFVAFGLFLMNSAMAPRPDKHDRERLKSFLLSGNKSRQFNAAAFLCSSIDPELMPELLRLCQNKDYAVAYTAQIAMGNMWGPKPRGLSNTQVELNPNLPKEYRERLAEQFEQQQKAMHDKWLKHYECINETLRHIVDDDGQAVEDLYALATGQNMHYEQARIVSIELLGSMRTPRAYATLMTIIQHRSKKIASAAIVSFYGTDSKAVLYLEKFFVSNRSWLRRRAIQATRCMLYYLLTFDPDDAAVAYSLLENDIDGLFDTDDTNTFAAAITLLAGRDAQDIEILESYYENDRPIIKIEAMCTLSYLVPKEAEKYVLPALDNACAAVRYAAIECVDILNLPQRGEIYQRMLADENERVSNLAQQRLFQLEALARRSNAWF